MFQNVAPGTLKIWLIVAAAVYFLVPFDLIPDFLGLPGRIDDLSVMALLAWFFRNHAKQYAARALGGQGARAGGAPPGPGDRQRRAKASDPYQVLGVATSASPDAIRAAYKERMKEYHPDKVAHLGAELQELAHEKSQQIQKAYHELSRPGK